MALWISTVDEHMPFLEEQESAYPFVAPTIWMPIHMSLDIRLCFSRLGSPPRIISAFNYLVLLFDRAMTGLFFLFSLFGPAQVAMSSAMAFYRSSLLSGFSYATI